MSRTILLVLLGGVIGYINRIAASIGQMVSAHLLDADTLQGSLLSEQMLGTIRARITQKLTSYETDARTVEEVLVLHFSEEKVTEYREKICIEGERLLMEKITEAELGSYVADIVEEQIREKSSSMSFLDMFRPMLDSVIEGIQPVVKEMVDQKIQEKGSAFLHTFIF